MSPYITVYFSSLLTSSNSETRWWNLFWFYNYARVYDSFELYRFQLSRWPEAQFAAAPLTSAVAKPDAAYFSTAVTTAEHQSRRQKVERRGSQTAARVFNEERALQVGWTAVAYFALPRSRGTWWAERSWPFWRGRGGCWWWSWCAGSAALRRFLLQCASGARGPSPPGRLSCSGVPRIPLNLAVHTSNTLGLTLSCPKYLE